MQEIGFISSPDAEGVRMDLQAINSESGGGKQRDGLTEKRKGDGGLPAAVSPSLLQVHASHFSRPSLLQLGYSHPARHAEGNTSHKESRVCS